MIVHRRKPADRERYIVIIKSYSYINISGEQFQINKRNKMGRINRAYNNALTSNVCNRIFNESEWLIIKILSINKLKTNVYSQTSLRSANSASTQRWSTGILDLLSANFEDRNPLNSQCRVPLSRHRKATPHYRYYGTSRRGRRGARPETRPRLPY